MLRWLLLVAVMMLAPLAAQAQDGETPRRFSQCQAIAGRMPGATFAGYEPSERPLLQRAAISDQPVSITYLGHSTFHIVTPEGVTIATDYNGSYKPAVPPLVATMNHAHMTHYTLTPEPELSPRQTNFPFEPLSDSPSEKTEPSLNR